MPLLKDNRYTSEDYWSLPEGTRAELIDGKFYDMEPPSRIHQEISYQLSRVIGNYIAEKGGSCKVYPAPVSYTHLDVYKRQGSSIFRSMVDFVTPRITVRPGLPILALIRLGITK